MSETRSNTENVHYDKIPDNVNRNDEVINAEFQKALGRILQEEQEVPKQKLSVWKNFIILCISMMLIFTAFSPLQNLQSTLHFERNIGTISLSVIYFVFILSYFFISLFLINHLGCKYTLCATVLAYCVFISANFKIDWTYIILPISSIITGLGSAPLWTAQGIYINILAKQFKLLSSGQHSTVIPRFFGIFGQIWGNLISSYILGLDKSNKNMTIINPQLCGKNFCPYIIKHSVLHNVYMPSNYGINLLCGIYLGCGLLSVLLILTTLENVKESRIATKISLDMLIKTVVHVQDPRQLLLIPMSCYVGLQMAFLASDFTASFVFCIWGIDKIGYVMMSYGLVNCISSIIFGVLGKVIGRIPFFFLGIIAHISLLSLTLTWAPMSGITIMFFIISSIWGMSDAIWQTQCSALYRTFFWENQDVGFNNKFLWESIGVVIGFGYSSFLCTTVKIYILLVLLNVATICFCFAEYLNWRKRSREVS